jgi:putative heme iron utilization protein
MDYFANARGTGVLATADAEGKVDAAIYAKPVVIDNNSIAFVMREQLSHKNMTSNPNAAYIFIEDSAGNKGLRLYLTLIADETNVSLVNKIIKEHPEICPYPDGANKYLVHFKVERIRELVGDKTL